MDPEREPLAGSTPRQPAWYTPKRLLALFCWLTFLIYLDQGVVASNGVNRPIQAEFQLGNVEDGFLPSAFLAGLLIASIVYSELTSRYNAFRMTGFGFAVWALGSVGCAMAPRFWVLILCRIVMGAGEASIITLSNPFIDDVAPPAQKTLWFGILNLFTTIGIAAGYIFGGVIGPPLGWRAAFLLQALLGVPIVVWLFFAQPVSLKTMRGAQDALLPGVPPENGVVPLASKGWLGGLGSLGRDVGTLWQHPVFILNLVAYCPIQGAFGAYTFWGPKAGYELFDLPQEFIDLTFGVVTIATSIVATLLGGLFIDMVGSSVRNAMAFCGWTALAGLLVIQAGFFFAQSFSVLMLLFAVGELALFAGQAPCSAVQIWTVPTRLRPLAAGMGTVTSHLFGDVPTPPLVGWVQGLVNNWRISMMILTAMLAISVVLYLAGGCMEGRDYRPEGERGLAPRKSVEASGDAEDGQAYQSLRDGLLDDREPVASINGQ